MIRLSALSLGTWTFAGDSIWSVSSEKEAVEVIRCGADRGVLFFDTAPNYGAGRSERILGKALGNRDDVQVGSKCKIQGLDRNAIRTSVEESLKSLKRDAIDLMQIHWPSSSPEETASALDLFGELVQEGKIRHIGVCNFGTADLLENGDAGIVSNQLPYSLMWRAIEENIGPYSHEMGLPVIAYSPLQQGLLSGRYKRLENFPGGRKRTRHYLSPDMEKVTQLCLDGFLDIAAESAIAPIDLAIGYILSKGFVSSVLAGARSLDQLDQLFKAVSASIPEDVIEALDVCSNSLYKSIGGDPDMYGHSRVRYTSSFRTKNNGVYNENTNICK